ncbi:MAG: phosphocholine cytidylyltransferase family protein [Limisphaerales bacterium]
MDAILYVAGQAHRLGTALNKPHKVLLEFGGISLLERHVMLLRVVGVKALHVVTGHARDSVAGRFDDLSARYGLRISEIHNRDFLEGSVLSMNVSLPVLKQATEPVLLMDGDVLYDGRMLQRLVQSKCRSALLFDRDYSKADDDPVLVPVRNGRPFDYVKKWAGEADAVGESVGFLKVAVEDLPILTEDATARSERSRSDSLDDVLRMMVQRNVFGAEDVTGLPWIEIDFPQDMEHAEKVILPALSDCY